jgi:hypothetical protein
MLERKIGAVRERIAARATAAITSKEDEALLISLTELQQRYR